jgi:hypothetical protein
VSVGMGLTVDAPGDGPDLGGDVLQQSGLAQGCFAEDAGEGGEGLDGDKAVGSGGQLCRAGLCEATTGHNGMDVRVGLQWPAPGVQDTGEAREVRPDETRVGGQPLEGHGSRLH